MRAAILLTLSLLLLARSAQAQPTSGEQERVARKACLVGDTAKGVEILADLFIDTRDPTHIYNQGRCFEQNRRYADAVARFREYLLKAVDLDAKAKAEVEQHIAACASYLAKGEGTEHAEVGEKSPAGSEPRATAVPAAAPVTATTAGPPQVTPPGVLPQATQETSERPHNRRTPGAIWLAFAGGTGGAYHGRQSVDSRSRSPVTNTVAPVAAGFAPASLFQLEPELGIQVSDRFALAIFLRYQYAPKDDAGYVPGPDEYPILTSAVAGFLRAEFSALNLSNFRGYLSGGVGVGKSFLAVIHKDCDMTSCPLSHSDTVSGGTLGLLAGLGAMVHLTTNLGIFLDAKEIVTFRTVLALTEINVGLAVAFDPW